MHGMKAQSAIEFLTTYGWAILIIAAAASMIYFFFNTVLGVTMFFRHLAGLPGHSNTESDYSF
jgi:hypothetical protein